MYLMLSTKKNLMSAILIYEMYRILVNIATFIILVLNAYNWCLVLHTVDKLP